jgi:thiamine biosynthesis lipoprotein
LQAAARNAEREATNDAPDLRRVDDYFVGTFQAMASPCTLLIDTDDRTEAAKCLAIANAEAIRIEQKFSRYRRDNIVYEINHA